jgi:hypothetical protein
LKSPDSAVVVIDEIAAFITGRMLSASEAAFRILGLRLHQEWPPILCLDIHLPNHERMVFDPTMAVEDLVLLRDNLTDTTLTAWFKLNQEDPHARQFLYIDIPEHYKWDKGKKKWLRRSTRSIAVGRTFGVSPRNSELYALRLLLNVVKGAVSWRCLLHHEGFIYGSFQESCRARGLIRDDSSVVNAFSEIVQNTVSSHSIRQQFATFLLHVQIESPISFFTAFASDLCDDEVSEVNIQNALIDIDSHLRSQHSSISSFGFEAVPSCRSDTHLPPDMAAVRRTYDQLMSLCCQEQKQAVIDVMTAVTSSPDTTSSNVFIIQGGAGTGKTMWINCVAAALKCEHRKVECMASSGLAASLIDGGHTAHSALGIPVPTLDSSFCRMDPATRQHYRNVDVIIWDEMSMVNVLTADCVDRSLQDVRNCSKPYGGIIMIFVGDFKQLCPVIRRGRGEFQTLHRCGWWNTAQKHVFVTNWRAHENAQFQSFLHEVGTGQLQTVQVPDENMCGDVSDLIQRTFGDNIVDETNDSSMVLAFKLEDVVTVNDYVMDLIPGVASAALASDNFNVDNHNVPAEYIASLAIPGVPAFVISLKVGARYMIIKNISIGVVNGTLCKVVGFTDNLVHVQLLTGCKRRSVVMLPQCTFHVLPEASGLPYAFTRSQFPIQVAYCVTVRISSDF